MTSFGTRPLTWRHCTSTGFRQGPLFFQLNIACHNIGCSKYSFACNKSFPCLQEGSKAIFHLEGFVARFMSEYKTWSIMMLGS